MTWSWRWLEQFKEEYYSLNDEDYLNSIDNLKGANDDDGHGEGMSCNSQAPGKEGFL